MITMMTLPDLKPGMPVYFAEVTGLEKIVDIPADCTRWRIRHRDGEFSRIFLRFPDRIEQRVLEYVEPGVLRPGFVKAVNVRKAA